MTRFTASTSAEAVVEAPRTRIWDVLVDPDAVADLTPFVRAITADGEHWTWSLAGLDVAGLSVSPEFTERMTFDEPERIDFAHDPPAGRAERSGVEGWYALTEVDAGSTRLETSLAITLDLPLPRVAGPAVRTAMKGVMATMGRGFSKALLARLQ